MAMLIGGILGSFLGMLVVCFLVSKFGPKKLAVNLTLQGLISGLLTLYLSTDHYGTHYAQVDVEANWIGWALALAIMSYFTVRKSRKLASSAVSSEA